MRMASFAKSTGSGKSLLPKGVDLNNITNDLFVALEHSLRVLSWQENLPGDECPPAWMWPLDWEIEEWFKKLKIERENKYGKHSSSKDYNDEGDSLFDENVYFDRLKSEGSLFE